MKQNLVAEKKPSNCEGLAPMALCSVGIDSLLRQTDTLSTPASKEDRSFYLSSEGVVDSEVDLAAGFDRSEALPDHTLEYILARIPFPSVGVTRGVCKRWQSVTTSSTFLALYSERQEQSESWLYVNGFRYKITDATAITDAPVLESSGHSWGAGGLAYMLPESSSALQYKLSILDPHWLATPALPVARMLPIVAAVKNGGRSNLIVAGGLPCDAIKESLSTVSLFDCESQTWSSCEDLPVEFQGLATSRSVSAVVCNRKLYLFHIYSGLVAALDVATRRWSQVTTLRPPGMQYCYLAVRRGSLLLVGVSHENDRFCFRGWNVDVAAPSGMECTGPSWPVSCHFGSVKSSQSFGNWQSKKPQSESEIISSGSSSRMDPLVAISNFLLSKIPFCAGIVGFFDALRGFSQAIS